MGGKFRTGRTQPFSRRRVYINIYDFLGWAKLGNLEGGTCAYSRCQYMRRYSWAGLLTGTLKLCNNYCTHIIIDASTKIMLENYTSSPFSPFSPFLASSRVFVHY